MSSVVVSGRVWFVLVLRRGSGYLMSSPLCPTSRAWCWLVTGGWGRSGNPLRQGDRVWLQRRQSQIERFILATLGRADRSRPLYVCGTGAGNDCRARRPGPRGDPRRAVLDDDISWRKTCWTCKISSQNLSQARRVSSVPHGPWLPEYASIACVHTARKLSPSGCSEHFYR